MPGPYRIVSGRRPRTHRFSCRTAYAVTGKKASQAWPDGSQVSYQWDDAQRLTEIKLPGTGSLSTQAFDVWNQTKEQLLQGETNVLVQGAAPERFGRKDKTVRCRYVSPGWSQQLGCGHSG